MDVRILGAVEIRPAGAQGEPTSVGGPRQRRILAALALWHDTVVSIDRLVEVTWPDEAPPAQADRNVRTYVHRIRNALPDEVAGRLVTQAPGYVLNLDPSEFDVDRFEEGVALAVRLRDRGDAAGAIARLDEALGEWRGVPLAEFADEHWARGDVTRIEEAQVGALELRAELLIGLDRPSAASAALEQLIDQHPFRERPRALQMRALYASGRQAEALRAFQAFREVLIDEVGVTPSQELIDLDRVIASGGSIDTDVSGSVRGYELHELIGTGAFADVHRGTQPALGREVAIKSIRSELANQPDFIRGFEAEASMVARLEHPHIVPLYDFWREPDRAFLVMRWLTGGTLEGSLDEGPWSPERVVAMVQQVGGALALAHRAGVVHRDVKPANILLDDDGNAYLSDFGIAVEAAGPENPAARLSAGSPAYASPEQLRREEVGPASDLHGLAIAAFEALTGTLPFRDARDEPTLLRHQLHDPIPPASSLRSTLPRQVDSVLARATAKTPEERHGSVADFVSDFVAALGDASEPTRLGDGIAGTVISGPVDNPYLGLRAFDEGDASAFFGRERLVAELVARMGAGARGDGLLAVVGPSGSGKSSVVRAGLVPALRRGAIEGATEWFVTTMTPGARPYEALEAALLRVAVNPPASLLEQLRSDKRGLIRGSRRILPTENGVALVIIDQFEELFTLCTDDIERAAFLDALAVAVTEADSPLRVVLTLRADFYDQPLRHPGFAELIKQQTVVVTPLAADELEQAITEPARAVGATFEPGLVAEIVADVAQEPGALPLMQHALRELFDARISGMMLRGTYEELGGLAGALGRRAEELYAALDEPGQTQTRRIFGRLVSLGDGSEDTRRRVRRSELGDDGAVTSVLDAFGRARLVSFDRDPATREPTAEVAHEALIREWPRLQTWLEEDRDGLRVQRAITEAAERWEASGRDPGDLLRGGRLGAAAEYAERGELTATEQRLVALSLDARDADVQRSHRTNRRLRRLTAAVSVVAIVALLAGVLAFVQRGRAQDEARQAEAAQSEAQARASEATEAQAAAEAAESAIAGALAVVREERARAETARLAAEASTGAATSPRVSLLLAREAYARDPSLSTLSDLQRTMLRAGNLLGYFGEVGTEYLAARWVRGGDAVLAVHRAGVEVFDVATAELVWTVTTPAPSTVATQRATPAGELAAVAVGDGGYLAALATDEGSVVILDLERFEARQVSVPGVMAVAVDPTTDRVAVGTADGRIRLIAPQDDGGWWISAHPEVGSQPFVDRLVESGIGPHNIFTGQWWRPEHERGVAALAFTPDGTRIISYDIPVARVWASADGAFEREFLVADDWSRWRVGTRAAVVERMQISRDDASVIDFAFDRNLTRIDWTTGSVVSSVPAPTGRLDANITTAGGGRSADGDWVVSLSDGRVVEVNDADGEPRQLLGGGLGEPSDLAIDDTGTRALVSGSGGIALLALDGSTMLADAVWQDPDITAVTISADRRLLSLGGVANRQFLVERDETSTYEERPAGRGLAEATVSFLQPASEVQVFTSFDLSALEDGRIAFSILDPETLEVMHSLSTVGYGEGVSNDGKLYAAGGLVGSTVVIFDVETGELVGQAVVNPAAQSLTTQDNLRSAAFDPVRPRLIAASQGGSAIVVDTARWEVIDVDHALDGTVVASYSPDGSVLVTVDRGGVISLRDPETLAVEREARSGQIPNDVGNSFAWSADGSVMLAAFGVTPRLWDVDSLRPIGDPYPNEAFAPFRPAPGLALATVWDGDVLVWNTDMATWADIACRAAGRNLTPAEWEQFGPAGEPYQATCPQFPPGS